MKAIWFGLIVGTAAIVAATPSHADRASLLPLIFRSCQNMLLSEGEQVARLSAAGVTVDEVCRCQAPLFISGLNAAQLAQFDQNPVHTTPDVATRFNETLGVCGGQLMMSRWQH